MAETTRELLELAAKACGIEIVGPVRKYIAQPDKRYEDGFIVRNDRGGDSCWNPLTDDGDGARLEEELQINVNWFSDRVKASSNTIPPVTVAEFFSEHESAPECLGDRKAARRLASLKVAAKIGRKQ